MLFLNQTEVYVLLAVCAAAAVGLIAIIVLSIWIIGRLRRRKAMMQQAAADGGEVAEGDGDASGEAEYAEGDAVPGRARPYPGTGEKGNTGIVPMPNGAMGAYMPYPMATYSPYYVYVVSPNAVLCYDANRYISPSVYIA